MKNMTNNKPKILHLLVSGDYGGIEMLLRDYARTSACENVFLFAWSGGEIAEQIRQEGSETHILSRDEWNIWKLVRLVINLCKERTIDTIVVHNAAPALRCVLLAVRLSNIKVKTVAYAHSDATDIVEIDRKGWRLRKLIYGASFVLADQVVAISHAVEQSLYSMWKQTIGKVRVIYNGVDLRRFEGTEKNINYPLRLLYVGRLTREKGVHIILNALAMVQSADRFTLTVVGDGPFRKQLEEQTQRLHLSGKVCFCGNSNNVPQYMNESNVFIHVPQWEEGFGLSVVEAMASGLLCICAAKGAMNEIITNEKDGILLQDTTAETLADCLDELPELYNTKKYKLMMHNAIKSAGRFSLQRFTKEMDELLV